MNQRLLTIWALLCATLLLTAGPLAAQDLRPEDTFFIKPRVGIANYLGDNEKSPTNFNGDILQIDGKLPWGVALELGYQFSVPFSLSAAYQLGSYPLITQFGEEEGSDRGINDDPTTRHTVQLFGRYTLAGKRTRVAPYIQAGAAFSFGDVAQQVNGVRTGQTASGSAFGPLIGIGLDWAVSDRSSVFIESVSSIALSDTELDAFEDNGFGSTDILTGIGMGLKINFKSAFTPVEVFSVNCPAQLIVGETGSFSATTNGEVASQPVEYRWDFGDGSTASGQSGSHSYTSGGSKTVTFTATNSGSSDMGTCTVRVIVPSQVVTITSDNTTVDNCEETAPVNFSANVQGDGPISYAWDFGDGSTSSQANPSHKFTAEGTYTVTLTVTNAGGTDTRTMSVSVTECTSFCDQITELNSVFFERNSSLLTDEARRQLAENVEILRQCPNINVAIEGYASRDERRTQRLSEDRARAVEQFYIDNGIAASRLTAVGLGAQGQTTKKGGASQFRRVDSIPSQQ